MVVASSENVAVQDLDEGDGVPGSEYTPVFAIFAFAAAYFQQATINTALVLKARLLCQKLSSWCCSDRRLKGFLTGD